MNELKNEYGCPTALWKKMTDKQKQHYNDVRSLHQGIINPVGGIGPITWGVISHNFAYLSSTLI